MSRNVALRASVVFIVLTVLALAIGLGSHAHLAEVLFLIGASVGAVTLAFAALAGLGARPAAVPVRVRRQRRR